MDVAADGDEVLNGRNELSKSCPIQGGTLIDTHISALTGVALSVVRDTSTLFLVSLFPFHHWTV
jgi:hypothetical protein